MLAACRPCGIDWTTGVSRVVLACRLRVGCQQADFLNVSGVQTLSIEWASLNRLMPACSR